MVIKTQGSPRMAEEGRLANVGPPGSRRSSAWMIVGGLLLILSVAAGIWLFRGELAALGPRALMKLWYGAGGLALLYLTAGLPLGAILLAAGGARLYPASERAERVLLPLLGIELVFFAFHAIRLMVDWSIPFLVFALMGYLFVLLFVALVWVWARKRPSLEAQGQRVADLTLGGALCFFNAAWQTCGLTGAPGFALYPELALRLGNQSFLGGQSLAVEVFAALGFVFLLLAMRAHGK
jgi:hypothetical protein